MPINFNIPGLPFKLDQSDMGIADPVGSISNGQSLINNLIVQKLNEAKVQKEQAMAKLPFGGASVPGPAGQVVGLEMVKQMYGQDSPQYQQASNAFNLNQQASGSRINYQDALTKTMGLRYTTPEGKATIETSNLNQGYSPTGTPIGQPVVPGQPGFNPNTTPTNDAANSYALKKIKTDVPASVLSKNLYASNIEKTLGNIDLDALTYYNSPAGQVKLAEQKLLDMANNSDSNYKAYKEAKTKLGFLSDQIRQFYAGSIQPKAMEELTARFDPTGAFTSKETGKQKFNSASDLLRKELQTYRDAGVGTQIYRGVEQKPTATQNNSNSGVNALAKKIQLPNFSSKEEYQKWFNAQPKFTQDAIRKHLRGG